MLPEITLMPLEFLRPFWLLALIAPLVLALVRFNKQKHSDKQPLIAPHLSANIVTKASHSKPHRLAFYSAFILACIALAGPTLRKIDMPVYEMEKAQIIAFDLSYSMYATDIKPNRLSQAKFKAIDLIKQWSEGEKAMIAYAGDAFTVAPLTRDGNAIINHVPHLSPDIMPVRGSRSDLALLKAVELLKNAGYSQGHIVFISDGISETDAQSMLDMLKGEPWVVSILAVGTSQGAPITLADGSLLKNDSGEIIVPKLSVKPFYDITKASKGLFLTSQNNNADIKQLASYFDDVKKNEQRANEANTSHADLFSIDDGYWLSFLLLPLCLLLFRKGTFFALIIGIYLPLTSPKLEASENPIIKDETSSIWNNSQQNAFKAYQAGNYQVANELYDSPMEKGSALYKSKQFEQSLSQFTQATELQPNDPNTFYNQGNSFAQLQQFDKAIEAYNKALALKPDMKQASENKALIENIQQQQNQQQDKKQNQQDQNNQQQDSQQQSQQQKQSEQDQQQQESQQQSQQKQSEQDQQQQESQQQSQQKQAEQDKQQQESQQQSQQKQAEQEQAKQEQRKQEEDQEQSIAQQTMQETDINKELEELPNWLKNMPDDPSILLRRKMQLEYQKRAQSQPIRQQKNDGVIW